MASLTKVEMVGFESRSWMLKYALSQFIHVTFIMQRLKKSLIHITLKNLDNYNSFIVHTY